jgi:outer membrane protein TolC
MKALIQSPAKSVPALRWTVWWVFISAGLLSACESTGPKVDAKSLILPPVYRHVVAQDVAETVPSSGDWWRQYGSDELNRLVDRALAHNADLRIATLQVAQAKIRADQARAGRLPSLTAPLRAVAQSQGSTTDSQQNSQLALAASFRLDVWGEQRALVDSADIQLARAVRTLR